MEPPEFETRDADELFGELMTLSAEVTKWNRKHASKLLDKANEIESRAAYIANVYRELAAALVLEAADYARDQADILMAEFPIQDRTASTEMPDEES